MGIFEKAFWGGFTGRLVCTIFIAVCLFFGIGPDTWVQFVISNLPSWIVPAIIQVIFIVLGLLTLVYFIGSFPESKGLPDDELLWLKDVADSWATELRLAGRHDKAVKIFDDLHTAYANGKILGEERVVVGQVRTYIFRKSLQKYVQSIGENPSFLFPEKP